MAKSGMLNSEVDSDDDEKKDVEQSCNNNEPDCDESVCVIARPVKTSTPVSILIESLVKTLCYSYESNPDNVARVYNYICEKLYSMKLIDESYNMNEFEGMRNQYQRALHQLLIRASSGDKNGTVNHSGGISPILLDVTSEWSHYYREFDEIEFIAGGGFGKVFKVKHKLDGTEYAVKKIYIRSEGIKSVRNYLSEVKTFASLNHSNIVQYKAAWLELGANIEKNAITEHTSESEFSYITETRNDNANNVNHHDTYIFPDIIIEEASFHKEESSDFEIAFEQQHQSFTGKIMKRSREKRNSISEGGNAICTLEEIEEIKMQARQHPRWATLYIQMTLCQTTLKQWLEKRNSELPSSGNESMMFDLRSNSIMEILKQLLNGLEYIHSKNIVHHDIKPSNIFLQMDNGTLLVQLGDFGLACPLQSARHTLALGTKLYAAPEQLNGHCNKKSDMYSLGVVLLELAENFRTDMEKVASINNLRKGYLPEHLRQQQPQLASIISQLVVPNPNERPDAESLLKRLTKDKDNESELVQHLKSQLAEKEQEIEYLRSIIQNEITKKSSDPIKGG